MNELEPITIFYGGLVLIVITLIIVLVFTGKEGFAPSYVTDKETYIQSSDVTSREPTILSNGAVQKHKDENGGYIYESYFNLPAIGSDFQVSQLDKPFNSPLKTDNYRVMIGNTDSDMKYAGDLKRESHGYHMFSYISPESYKKVCVYIGSSLVGCATL